MEQFNKRLWISLIILIGVFTMAIHDVDKNNGDRLSPMPNSHDALGQRLANGTLSINPRTGASGTNAFTQTKNGRLLVNDGTTNRIVVGAQSDGTFGMKVSQPGNDVLTAPNSNMVFNSSQDVFKIVAKGTTTIPAFAVGSAQLNYSYVQIPHGLSFTPIVQAFASGYWVKGATGVQSSTYIPLPTFIPGQGALGAYFFQTSGGYRAADIIFAVDSTNISFQAATDSSLSVDTMLAIPITYFILQETVN
jgi:hypothetical protein